MQIIRDMQAAPTEIDLISDTVDVLTNSSAPPEEILMALEALQSLVEPIDNANSKPAWCSHGHTAILGLLWAHTPARVA